MNDLTLGTLFFSKAKIATKAKGMLGKHLDPEDPALIAIKNDIEEHLPRLSWKMVEKELETKIGEVLHIGLDDVLLAGWKKYRGLCEYADAGKHPPEETTLVPLARHLVRSAHRPHIDLLIREARVGGLVLDVQLALALEGVVLKVRGGRVWDVTAGSCQASGTLKCLLESRVGSKEILVLKKESPQLRLPGAFHLEGGMAIPAFGA